MEDKERRRSRQASDRPAVETKRHQRTLSRAGPPGREEKQLPQSQASPVRATATVTTKHSKKPSVTSVSGGESALRVLAARVHPALGGSSSSAANPAARSRPRSSTQTATSTPAQSDSVETPAPARQPPSQPLSTQPKRLLKPASAPTPTNHHRRHSSAVDVPRPTPEPSPPSLPAATTTTTSTSTSKPSSLPTSSRSPSSSSPSSTSPSGKNRFPARFSSNGIATSDGPPPSLAYRRKNLSMDGRGSYSPKNTSYGGSAGNRSSASSSTISAHQLSRSGSRNTRTRTDTSSSRRNSLQLDGDTNQYDDRDDNDRTIRGLEDLKERGKLLDAAPVESGSGDDDIFLRLARSSTGTPQKIERRRTRLSQYSHHRNSLPLEHVPSPLHDHVSQSDEAEPIDSSPPHVTDETWRSNARLSSPSDYRSRRMSNTSNYSDHLEDGADDRRSKQRTPTSRALNIRRNEHSPGAGHTRSYSLAEPALLRSRTLTNGVSPRTLQSSPLHDDRPQPDILDHDFAAPESANHFGRTGGASSGGHEDSASSVSTTAQSSVWDELDDLKSRIRRLELTGKLPASGRANGNTSNSSGDRPRTATTTVTTISSSPRRNNPSGNGPSPPDSAASAVSPAGHPLLHSALAKTKPLIHPDVYKHLEVAANDALALVGAVGGPGTTDRQIRRKADSVCRSITELCIALSEQRTLVANHLPHLQTESRLSSSRPVSRDTARESMFLGRESVLGDRSSVIGDRSSIIGDRSSVVGDRTSVVGDRISARERAYHRLAERRGSIVSLSNAGGFSPRFRATGEPVSSPTTTTGTLRQRPSMLLKSRSPVNDEEEYDIRAPSRTTTEINTHRSPRDYHSLAPERSSTIGHNSSIVAPRRQFVSNTANSASSPGISTGRRFFSQSHQPESSPLVDRTFDLNNPRNERLMSAAAADPDYTTTRFRSGSLGRAGSDRLRREMRESLDLGRTRTTVDRLSRR